MPDKTGSYINNMPSNVANQEPPTSTNYELGTLLITGATGFIGRNFLLQALSAGRWSEIIAPVRNPEKLYSLLLTEGWKTPPTNLRILKCTPESWGNDLGCDAAVHCAGVLFGRSTREYYSTNVQGTLKLLKKLPPAAKVVLLSSQSAGGPTPQSCEFRDETTPDHPITDYGKSKKEMEETCLSSFPERDLIILRPPMVLGARDQATLPLFRLARKRLWPKPGFLSKRFSFVAAADLCRAIFTVLENDTKFLQCRIFYISHPESISDRELIECSGKLLGKKGLVLPLPHNIVQAVAFFVDAFPALRNAVPSLTRDRVREIWPNCWIVHGDRFEKMFHFHCKVGLEESLSDALKWYRKIGAL